MKISKLSKFKENYKFYSILSFLSILIAIIVLAILAIIYNDERRMVIIRVIYFLIVLLIISLEAMLEALTIHINTYKNNDDEYVLYTGVFNTYLFLNDKEVMSNYSINCFTRLTMHYLNEKDELIEFNLSALANRALFKINGNLIDKEK